MKTPVESPSTTSDRPKHTTIIINNNKCLYQPAVKFTRERCMSILNSLLLLILSSWSVSALFARKFTPFLLRWFWHCICGDEMFCVRRSSVSFLNSDCRLNVRTFGTKRYKQTLMHVDVIKCYNWSRYRFSLACAMCAIPLHVSAQMIFSEIFYLPLKVS